MQERTLRREYFDNKLTKLQIANKYGMGESTVSYYFTKYGIRPLKPYERLDLPDLTDDQRAFIIGTMLGDASLEVTHTSINARINIEHSSKQRDYVNWKYNIIEPYVSRSGIWHRTRLLSGKSHDMYGFRTICHPIFTNMWNIFYDRGVKVVTNEIANSLSPLSIATWLMDDGGRNGNCVIFCTHSFTPPEIDRLRKVLQYKYNIYTTKQSAGYRKGSNQKCYVIYVLKKSMNTLYDLVVPHIIPSMMYKIETSTQGSPEATRRTSIVEEDMVQARPIGR